MDSPIIHVRLPQETLDRLKALSAETHFSISDLIRARIDRAYPYVEAKAREAAISKAQP
jgi:predicted DNA-binding protein